MKITLNVIYNIVYNKEKINPEEDIMLHIQHPHTMKFIDGLNDDNDISIEPVANTDKKIEENNTLFSEPWTNEMRASEWEIEIKNEQWRHLFSSEHSSVLKIHFKIFQFNQDTGESEKNYDENKISSIKILDLTPDKNYELENKMVEKRKLKELNTAKEHEKLLEFEDAAKIYKKYGMTDDVIRVRKAAQVNQTVVHGDYVDDRDTIVKDSVINRSIVGSGGDDKLTKIKELKELHDTGAIDDDEFKQMKKEILGK